jgi:rhodanese-related sulfurtransferase
VNVQEQSQGTSRQPVVGKVLGETILVAIVGALVALAANRISPRGLSLARNYFPQVKPVSAPTAVVTNSSPAQAATNESATQSEPESPVARLKSKGLQVVGFDEVKKLLHDPGYQTGSIIFIDARGEEYPAGHIPGAYQLDYYHEDKYLLTALPACQNASRIVVYCSGGDCQDSEMTALMLRDGGVPNEKLFVYSGGMTEWDEKKEPIETGARNSGQMLAPNK